MCRPILISSENTAAGSIEPGISRLDRIWHRTRPEQQLGLPAKTQSFIFGPGQEPVFVRTKLHTAQGFCVTHKGSDQNRFVGTANLPKSRHCVLMSGRQQIECPIEGDFGSTGEVRVEFNCFGRLSQCPHAHDPVGAGGDRLASIRAERSGIDLVWMRQYQRLGWRGQRPYAHRSIIGSSCEPDPSSLAKAMASARDGLVVLSWARRPGATRAGPHHRRKAQRYICHHL